MSTVVLPETLQNRMLTVREVAEFLGVTTRTVYHEIDAGHLSATKVRGSLRVAPEWLETYLDDGRKGGWHDS